jgi:hypothetical protein
MAPDVNPNSTAGLITQNSGPDSDQPGADAAPSADDSTMTPGQSTNLPPDIKTTAGTTNMFHSDTTGINVVFVLDDSTNMESGGKSAAARQELLNHLQEMTPASKFDVLFSHSGGYEEMPARSLLAATPENIRAMTNWLFSVGHTNGTDPAGAVERALGLGPAPDTIWLLSGDEFPAADVDAIRQTNALIRAQINTIDYYSHFGEPVLRDIADQNHGVYRYVPPPEAKPQPAATSTNAIPPSSPGQGIGPAAADLMNAATNANPPSSP